LDGKSSLPRIHIGWPPLTFTHYPVFFFIVIFLKNKFNIKTLKISIRSFFNCNTTHDTLNPPFALSENKIK